MSSSQGQGKSEDVDPVWGYIAPSNIPLLRPLGVSPSREQLEGAFIGHNWPPPELAALDWVNAPRPKIAEDTFGRLFGRGSPWTAESYPVVLLAEFVAISEGAWKRISLSEEGIEAYLQSELTELVELMDYRAGVLSEFLAQNNGILDYLRGIFSFSARSHPITYALGATAIHVGQFQAMYHKFLRSRPRPSNLSPRLMPPVDVPGHASFPSGHATQARLVARFLAKVMPTPAEAPLLSLADRIARNREVMGLNYPSDSRAGQSLADQTFELLMQSNTVKKMIAAAREEWGILSPAEANEAMHRPQHEPSAGVAAPSVLTGQQMAGQRVFIRLPHAMLMTAGGAQRSAAEVVAMVTGTQAHSRALEAVPEIAVGLITPDEQTRLLSEGAQVFPDVQFKIFDDALKPELPARFWEAPDLLAGAAGAPTLTDVIRHVRADRAWEVTQGRNVTIAVVDSGIAPDLPELPAGAKRSPVDPGGFYSGSHWQDLVGHGSMCATIACGGGGGSAFRGVAPEATVLSVRSDLSAIDISTVYTGMILAKRQGRIPGPLVISNSWGLYACGSQGYMPQNHPFMDVILLAVAEGITVVFAAGNNHVTQCNANPRADSPNSIWGPNSHDKVITVGTVNRAETNRDPETPHKDSSRGRGEWAQLRDKPDCVAPTYGEVVWGSSRRYMAWWGTSGACPQVAGLAALMYSIKPGLRPEQVADIIRNTCRRPVDEPALCVGHGVIDCEAAVLRAQATRP
jgi:subtilisin family serine protease